MICIKYLFLVIINITKSLHLDQRMEVNVNTLHGDLNTSHSLHSKVKVLKLQLHKNNNLQLNMYEISDIPARELLTSDEWEPDLDRFDEEEWVESETQLRESSTASSGNSRTPLTSFWKRDIMYSDVQMYRI